MKTRYWLALAQAGAFLVLPIRPAGAAVLAEDFSTDPAARGWQSSGEASAFHWSAAGQALEVTWDSTRPNSYFFHPLGTVLAKDDDFSLAFDLRLTDVAGGAVSNRTGPFELAIGFLNLAQATQAGFRRGTGSNAQNLVEFDYFPAGYYDIPEWGGYFPVDPTVSPTVISQSGEFATGFTTPLELTSNDWFHIRLRYTASNHTLATALLRNGQPYLPVADTVLTDAFSDFRVDVVSINCYSDAGDPYDSLLAHGVVDNLVVTVPDAPKLTGGFVGGLWTVQFASRTNWLYTLERTTNWAWWETVSAPASGTGLLLTVQETSPAASPAAFYRIQAQRP